MRSSSEKSSWRVVSLACIEAWDDFSLFCLAPGAMHGLPLIISIDIQQAQKDVVITIEKDMSVSLYTQFS